MITSEACGVTVVTNDNLRHLLSQMIDIYLLGLRQDWNVAKPSTEVDEIHSKPLADTDAFEGEIVYDLSVTVQVTQLSVALTAGDNVACQQPEKPPRNRVTKHMGAKGFGLYHTGGRSRQTSASTTPAPRLVCV